MKLNELLRQKSERFLTVDKACKAILRPTPGLNNKTFDSSSKILSTGEHNVYVHTAVPLHGSSWQGKPEPPNKTTSMEPH